MIIYISIGPPVNPQAVKNLIISSEHVVSVQIDGHDENTKLPIYNGQQHFEYGAADCQIIVSNIPRHELTWGDMRDLLRGLYNYLVAGKRNSTCAFQFSVGVSGRVGQGHVQYR